MTKYYFENDEYWNTFCVSKSRYAAATIRYLNGTVLLEGTPTTPEQTFQEAKELFVTYHREKLEKALNLKEEDVE